MLALPLIQVKRLKGQKIKKPPQKGMPTVSGEQQFILIFRIIFHILVFVMSNVQCYFHKTTEINVKNEKLEIN